MALSVDQKQAIERARARVAEESIAIERTFFDEAFTFRFLPTLTQPALEIVARVQAMASSDGANIGEQFHALVEFMDAMATTDTGELISELASDGIMTINDLVELQQEVIQHVAARPTMRSSSSASGSPTAGESSTASAPAAASIPPPSLSTAS